MAIPLGLNSEAEFTSHGSWHIVLLFICIWCIIHIYYRMAANAGGNSMVVVDAASIDHWG